MFGLFKSPPYLDPQLGELTRSCGHWRGTLALEGGARFQANRFVELCGSVLPA
jgi:hypothetical protein